MKSKQATDNKVSAPYSTKIEDRLAGFACTVLSIIIIFITAESEPDWDTCREDVDTAEWERSKNVCVMTWLCLLRIWDEQKITATTTQSKDNSSAF